MEWSHNDAAKLISLGRFNYRNEKQNTLGVNMISLLGKSVESASATCCAGMPDTSVTHTALYFISYFSSVAITGDFNAFASFSN